MPGFSALMRHSIACAALHDVVPAERQRLARGDADLLLDQVDAGDHFGHRMLDLNAGVHFDEVEVAVLIDDELDRRRVGVVRRLESAARPLRTSRRAFRA